MTTLTITDLSHVDTIDRDAMSAVRGGILYVTKPGGGDVVPGVPTSWPGAAILKDLHIPTTWPISTAQPAQDPRLL
jgi:hypothetical protein